MPRIRLRTEPYSSPARQQSHFKAKRDRTLKQLGSASHINGSQFAFMLVSAKGEVEVYATELFKPSLPRWMNETIKSEARTILLEDKERRVNNPHLGGQQLVEVELLDDVYQVSSDFLELGGEHISPTRRSGLVGAPTRRHITIFIAYKNPPKLSSDIELAKQLFKQASEESSLTPVALTGGSLTPSTTDTLVPAPAATPSPNGVTSALDEWFCNKSHVLQQNTCKLVAKCWIKVIEPKKQNKYPYQRTDHLIKPERNALLLAILNSGRVPVTRLELSTADAMAHIQPDKFAILREIYTMAKEQELRRNNPDYKPRVPLTAVPVIPHVPSPVVDHIGHNSTLGKRQRFSSENMTDTEARRQSCRVTLDMQPIHDPVDKFPRTPCTFLCHRIHFAFAPHRMPSMLHHSDALAFGPPKPASPRDIRPQHFPLPLPGAPFPFAPLGGEHLAFPVAHHLPPPVFNEELAHLIARRSAQGTQASQPLDSIHDLVRRNQTLLLQAGAARPLEDPRSRSACHSASSLIELKCYDDSFPQNPLIAEGIAAPGLYHPVPAYPTSAPADSWSTDSQQLENSVDESRPVSPPGDSLSTSAASAHLEESQQSSMTEEVDTAWLK
ncbi:hypothetical protein FS837_009866 [Tulasnella sp. UAMH 9824]|nr:hypothetical protein FS837_009866 [Tulasnella sp. UAMH 9824]